LEYSLASAIEGISDGRRRQHVIWMHDKEGTCFVIIEFELM
jgi:hypothetical protein